MSSTPPQEDPTPQPPQSRPPRLPWQELTAAVIVALPVGFLTDYPTAVEALLTVFSGMISVRKVSDRR
ncbi:hypothetical protein [Nocardia sp. NPDC050175]|uniref:hypothetical protein n=1 Tax=Nocardia sp. NPDC050175 TaxID=3364317 RepID=UPI00379A3D60